VHNNHSSKLDLALALNLNSKPDLALALNLNSNSKWVQLPFKKRFGKTLR
jgi:hypothetical protein